MSLSRRHFLRTAGLGLSSLALGCGRSDPPGAPSLRFADYRALVCVFLYGGNDGYNLLVPVTPEKYDPYARVRLSLAVPREQLLPLAGRAADGAQYGLHPACERLWELATRGRAAVLANVGSLSHPTSRSDVASGRVPDRLFSHNDQQDQWQTAQADSASFSGWAGRIADVMTDVNRSAELPLNFSLAGNNLLQRGAESVLFSIAPGGPQRLHGMAGNNTLRSGVDQLRSSESPLLLEQAYVEVLDRGIRLNELLAAELAEAPALATPFPEGNALAVQLQMVARLIAIRDQLGMRRQIFFVAQGGYDTHDAQAENHPKLLRQLSEALAAFHAATAELNLEGAVTSFTASDFGRSLTVNGKGTDHGWSSHQLILGGAVRGGQIYGMPPSLVPDAEDDTRGGRFIPQTSVDEYAATLARWFGVSDGELDYVLPNLRRFAHRDLGFMA
jgi:uncharacterized protein (DUF1501 family)